VGAHAGDVIERDMSNRADTSCLEECANTSHGISSPAHPCVHEQPGIETAHAVDATEAPAVEVNDSRPQQAEGDRVDFQGDAVASVAAPTLEGVGDVAVVAQHHFQAACSHAVAQEALVDAPGTERSAGDCENQSMEHADELYEGVQVIPAEEGVPLAPSDHLPDAADVLNASSGFVQQHLQADAPSTAAAAASVDALALQAPSAVDHPTASQVEHASACQEEAMEISPQGDAELAGVGTPPSSLGPGFVTAVLLRDSQREQAERAASASAGPRELCDAGCSTPPHLQPSSLIRALTADQNMRCDEPPRRGNSTGPNAVTSTSEHHYHFAGGISELLAAAPSAEHLCHPSLPSTQMPVSARSPQPQTIPASSAVPSGAHEQIQQAAVHMHEPAVSMPAFRTAAEVSRGLEPHSSSGDKEIADCQSSPQLERHDNALQRVAAEHEQIYRVPVQVIGDQVGGEAACQETAAGSSPLEPRMFVERCSAGTRKQESPCLRQQPSVKSPVCSTILARLRDWDSWTGSKALATQVRCSKHSSACCGNGGTHCNDQAHKSLKVLFRSMQALFLKWRIAGNECTT
jgi:hypothetical protein